MSSDKEFAQLVTVIDQQKGELLYLHTLVNAIMTATPPEFQAAVVEHFDRLAESCRRSLLYSQASDGVSASFEHYVKSLRNRGPAKN